MIEQFNKKEDFTYVCEEFEFSNQITEFLNKHKNDYELVSFCYARKDLFCAIFKKYNISKKEE